MDYNVQYHIDINGSAASSQLSIIATQVQNLVPKMSSQFSKLSKTLDTFHKSMAALQTVSKIPTIDVNTSKALSKVKELKQEIAGIKNITITPRVPSNKTTGRISGGKTNTSSGDSGAFGYYRSRLGTTGLLTALGVPYAGMLGTVAIGRGISSIVGSSVEYEHTMDLAHSILKAHDGDLSTFQSRFDEMSKHMRQIGVETQFTATQIADATKFLAMAGLNVEQIDAAMKPITNLAIIGDADLGQMADLTTNIITGYGIKTKDIAAVSDIMASISTGSNTTVLEMAEAFKYAGGQLSTAGISFNEASSAMGILANAGMKATVAGTGLRAMMMRMINPPQKAKKVLDALGVSFTKVDEKGKKSIKSLQESFNDLHKAGAGIEELNKIFDKTASKAAIALMTNTDDLKKLTDESINSFGIADTLATKRQDTVKGLWYQISSQFTEDGMQVFEAMTPLIKGYMHDILDYLKTPQAVQMIRDTVYMFKNLLDILIKIGGWVVENWDWIKHFVIGGFFAKKIFQISSSVLSLANNVTSLLGPLGSMSRILGSAGAGAGAAGAGLGIIGKFGIWGAVIAAICGGFIALNAHVDTLATKADVAYNKLSNIGAWKPFLSETALPNIGISNVKSQTVSELYEDLIKSSGHDGSGFSTIANIYSSQKQNANSTGKGNSQYSNNAANAASVAHTLANNDSFALSRNLFDKAIALGPNKWKNVLGEIDEINIKDRAKVKYQFRDMYGINMSKHGHNAFTNSSIFPSLITAWSNKLDATDIYKTMEYQQQKEKNLLDISKSIQQFNSIRFTTNKSKQLSELFDWIYRTSSIAVRPEDFGVQPTMGQNGEFILQDIPGFNKDNKNTKSIIAKLREFYLTNYSQLTLDEIIKILPITNHITDNNLNQKHNDIPISGLEDDPSLNIGGGGGGKGSGSTLRHITVNIDKLMSVDSISVNTDDDIDAFKEKMKKALMDVIKDVEISY